MDDLISQIVQKTGITTQQAKESVTISAAWVKEGPTSDVVAQFGGLLDGAGDMAAGAVEKARGAGASVTSAAGVAASTGTEAAGGAWEKTKGAVSDLIPGDD